MQIQHMKYKQILNVLIPSIASISLHSHIISSPVSLKSKPVDPLDQSAVAH